MLRQRMAVVALLAVETLQAGAVCTETAVARFVMTDGTVERRMLPLTPSGSDAWRLMVPRASIPATAKWLEIVPAFMTARKGDSGYWINGRGVYGHFDKNAGENRWWRSQMPLYGLKRGDSLHWAQLRTYRFDYDLVVKVKNSAYEIFPRIRFDKVREFFPLYDDVEIEFHRLMGTAADYNGIAHAYQRERLSRGEIQPIRERMKTYSELGYMSEAMVIRLQTHGAKSILGKPMDFYPTNEPPINVYLPFDKAEEFVQAVKDAGVDKAAFVSAGWNAGGYDGRLPDHFPVEPTFGGEKGLKRLVRRTQNLGFLMMLHATHTEVYRVCPHFDECVIAKKPNGDWCWNGLYFGGSCYWICERCSWKGWIVDEMRRMRTLGTHGSHYVDVFSATYPNRCADPRHPATPEQMAGYQNRILAEAKCVFGGASSEGGYDHVAGNIDCINYVSVEMKKLHDGKTKGLELVSGVYPLWELVYHGIILYTSDRLTQNHTRGQNHAKKDESGNLDWLEGDGIVDPRISLKIVEWGGRPIFYSYKVRDVPMIARAVEEFKPVRHLQKELMLSHREVAPQVFETVYGNGARTLCNYNDHEVEYNGIRIHSLGYRLINE